MSQLHLIWTSSIARIQQLLENSLVISKLHQTFLLKSIDLESQDQTVRLAKNLGSAPNQK